MTCRVGTCVRDITPKGPVPLFGYPHVERVSSGTHDPLLMTVAAIDNGADRVLIGALDILFLEPPVARRMRRTAADAAGIPEDRVFLGCTHTHSGPVTSRLIAFGCVGVNSCSGRDA